MPSLDDFTDAPASKPPLAVIYGKQGIGKTSFAAAGENPVLLATEDGADFIKVKRARVNSYGDMLEYIKLLATTEHKTLIIDSLDHFEPMLHAQMVADKGMPLEKIGGGFFRWRSEAREYWAKFIDYCQRWQKRTNGSVFLLAHEKIEEVHDPRVDPYSRFTLKLDNAAVGFLLESVDLIGYMNTNITTNDTSDDSHKIAVSGNNRRLFLDETSAAYTAKRRAPGLPKFIDLPSAKQGMENFTNAWNTRKEA